MANKLYIFKNRDPRVSMVQYLVKAETDQEATNIFMSAFEYTAYGPHDKIELVEDGEHTRSWRRNRFIDPTCARVVSTKIENRIFSFLPLGADISIRSKAERN